MLVDESFVARISLLLWRPNWITSTKSKNSSHGRRRSRTYHTTIFIDSYLPSAGYAIAVTKSIREAVGNKSTNCFFFFMIVSGSITMRLLVGISLIGHIDFHRKYTQKCAARYPQRKAPKLISRTYQDIKILDQWHCWSKRTEFCSYSTHYFSPFTTALAHSK